MSNQRGIYIINTFLNRKFGEEKKKKLKMSIAWFNFKF